MFRRRDAIPEEEAPETQSAAAPVERVSSVMGAGTILNGKLSGTGGVRIEGTFEGEIALRGLLVVGEQGRVTCEHVRANVVIVAGLLRGNITAKKVEIRSTGRVWGDVETEAFATEEGAFLRGQITMEDQVDTGLAPLTPDEPSLEDEPDGEGEQ